MKFDTITQKKYPEYELIDEEEKAKLLKLKEEEVRKSGITQKSEVQKFVIKEFKRIERNNKKASATIEVKKPIFSNKLEKCFEYSTKIPYKVIDVADWDSVAGIILQLGNFKKINGVIVKEDNNLATKEDINSVISSYVSNISPYFTSQIHSKINQVKGENIPITSEYIMFKNGAYRVEDGKFFDNKDGQEYISVNKIPHNYVKHAKSELGEEIFSRYSKNNEDWREQIFEAVGVMCIQKRVKVTIVCNGPSNTAKSFLYNNIVLPAIGEHNSTIIRIDDLDSEEVASLINKTAAYEDDATRGSLSHKTIAHFKRITGSDILKGKILYKDKFSFKNYATMWINTNGMINMLDSGTGGSIENRIQMINFTVNMKKAHNEPNLDKRIAKEQKEISEWLLANAMRALTRLQNNGYEFTESYLSNGEKERHLLRTDSVYKFMKEFGPLQNGDSYLIKDKYYDYVKEFDEYNSVTQTRGILYGLGNPKPFKYFVEDVKEYAEKLDFRTYLSGGGSSNYYKIKKISEKHLINKKIAKSINTTNEMFEKDQFDSKGE